MNASVFCLSIPDVVVWVDGTLSPERGRSSSSLIYLSATSAIRAEHFIKYARIDEHWQ